MFEKYLIKLNIKQIYVIIFVLIYLFGFFSGFIIGTEHEQNRFINFIKNKSIHNEKFRIDNDVYSIKYIEKYNKPNVENIVLINGSVIK